MALSRDADYTMYLYTCNRCRSCAVEPSPERRSICPSYARMGFFAYSGGGKGYVAQGILEGKVKPSDEVAQVAMSCLSCGACAQACPPGFDIMSFIRDLRDTLVAKGCYANDAHRALLKKLRLSGNPWAKANFPVELPAYSGQDVLLFRGCRERVKPTVLPAVEKILDAAGVSFGVLPDEPCCGSPSLELGDKAGFEDRAQKTLELIEASGAERVLALCPHCAAAMAVDAMEVGVLDAELITLPTFLAELFGEGRLAVDDKAGDAVTYHDPCRLGRWLEDMDSARDLLSALNLEVREMERRGVYTHCCGAGGWLAGVAPEVAAYAARERIAEAKNTGASTIVTSCSYCVDFLSGKSRGLQVVHLADALAARLKS